MLSQSTENLSPSAAQIPPQMGEKENRRIQRISLPLPVRVEVMVDPKMTWNEITRLSDVSAFGAGFTLKRPVKRGRMVVLTLPMPRQLRSYDYSEPQYKIWALIRRCVPVTSSGKPVEYAVGVAFTGKNPPRGYLEHPATLYDISQGIQTSGFWQLAPADLVRDETALPSEYRKQTRLSIPEPVRLERVDEAMNVLAEELTVTENISLGGAAVFTSLDIERGSFLRVTSDRLNVTILSVVRSTRVGQDGIKRAHIEFIDRFFPLEGFE